ncbi:MAG: hypothetical protein EBQ80_05385 [Proteobacteria bacterium]|nr:hypothetical protein [Pseudomonadota bacterium]
MQQERAPVLSNNLGIWNVSSFSLLAAGFAEMLGGEDDADDRLIPVVLLHPDGFLALSFWVALGSVLGAFVIYSVGYLLFLFAGGWLVQSAGLLGEGVAQGIVALRAVMADYAAVMVLAAGFSVIPLRLMALVSGFCLVNPLVFAAAALTARGARQAVLAWLLWRGGVRYKEWIESYYHGLTTVLGVGLLLVFLLILALVTMD